MSDPYEWKGPISGIASLGADWVQRGRQQRQEREMRAYQQRQEQAMQEDRLEAKRDRARQRRQQRNTPDRKSLRRALVGAALLTVCLWLSPVMLNLYRWSLAHPSDDLWQFVWPSLGLWGFALVMGFVGLLVGLREARF